MKNIIEILKNNLKGVIGVGLIAIAGLATNTLVKKDVEPIQNNIIEEVDQEVPVSLPVKKTKSTNTSPAVTVDTRSYTELVNSYKNRTLQFGTSCQVVMSNYVYKLGSEILLDNRNNMPLTIKLGSDSYDLGSYGYKVVTLGAEGKFMIDCGANQNVVTITVQK